MLDLQQLQQIQDKFSECDADQMKSTLNLNKDQMLRAKSMYFKNLYELFCSAIGQFFIIYQRMLYHKEKCEK